MRFELTVYDTEAREDRVREYTESRKRAAVWARMPRVQLSGSFHHLIFRVREYSHGTMKPQKFLRDQLPQQDKNLSDLHQRVREAKSLTSPQAQLLIAAEEAGENGVRIFSRHSLSGKRRLVQAGLVDAEGDMLYITDRGREFLELRLLP